MANDRERVRFYLDENVPRAVAEGLRRRDIDAVRVQELGLRGGEDLHHLNIASEQSRVIFTMDSDFLRLHALGHPHSGITYAKAGTSISVIMQGLLLIYELLTPNEMENHVEFIA